MKYKYLRKSSSILSRQSVKHAEVTITRNLELVTKANVIIQATYGLGDVGGKKETGAMQDEIHRRMKNRASPVLINSSLMMDEGPEAPLPNNVAESEPAPTPNNVAESNPPTKTEEGGPVPSPTKTEESKCVHEPLTLVAGHVVLMHPTKTEEGEPVPAPKPTNTEAGIFGVVKDLQETIEEPTKENGGEDAAADGTISDLLDDGTVINADGTISDLLEDGTVINTDGTVCESHLLADGTIVVENGVGYDPDEGGKRGYGWERLAAAANDSKGNYGLNIEELEEVLVGPKPKKKKKVPFVHPSLKISPYGNVAKIELEQHEEHLKYQKEHHDNPYGGDTAPSGKSAGKIEDGLWASSVSSLTTPRVTRVTRRTSHKLNYHERQELKQKEEETKQREKKLQALKKRHLMQLKHQGHHENEHTNHVNHTDV